MTIEDTPRFYKGSTTLIDDIIQPPIFWVQYLGHLVVLWTLLYGFVIFPNHPSPAMLECHEEVYYNNQTEALERDKTCELDTQTMWGLAFLAGVASGMGTHVVVYCISSPTFLFFLTLVVYLVLYVIGLICHGCAERIWANIKSVVENEELIATVYTIFVPPVVLWTLLYGFVIFPNHPSPAMLECHEEVYYNNQTEALERDKTCELDTQTMWGLAFLAGVASSGLVFVLSYLTYRHSPSRSQNDTVEQEEEDTA